MSLADPRKAKVVHVLRDGTVLDSIAGHVVKFEDAEPLYRMIDNMNRERTHQHETQSA